MRQKLKKFLIRLLLGTPNCIEPVYYHSNPDNCTRTVMPIEGITMEEWKNGNYVQSMNSKLLA